MDQQYRRLSTLILWEIAIVILLIVLFTYVPRFLELESYGEVVEEVLPPVIIVIFAVIATRLFLYVLQPIFSRALSRYLSSSYDVKQTWQFIRYLIWITTFILLAFLFLGNTTLLLGILALVFIIMSYNSLANFAGWLQIIFTSPIRRGDLVEIDGIKGKISEVSTVNLTLEEMSGSLEEISRTGRKVTIPNSFVFTKSFFSLPSESSLVWDDIRILLPSMTNHALARDIMTQVGRSIAGPIMKKHGQEIIKQVGPKSEVPTMPVTMVSLEPEGIQVILRYFCPLSERGGVRSAISEGVLKEFEREGIQLVFRNPRG